MKPGTQIRRLLKWASGTLSFAAAGYTAYVGNEWLRYGKETLVSGDEAADPLLNRFMPEPEVREHHCIHVNAPAGTTFAAAVETDLLESAIVRSIFRVRELILGSQSEKPSLPKGLVAQARALGWGLLAEVPGREIVFAAATQPWAKKVVFYSLSPGYFARFDEPGYVKIAWSVRVVPVGGRRSLAVTETRVTATDCTARKKFRWYWSVFSPGIVLIRRILLRRIKIEAEKRIVEELTSHSFQHRRATDNNRVSIITTEHVA